MRIKDNDKLRFWSKVKKTKKCWNFLAAFTRDGYGQLGIDGSMRRAHRISWILKHGKIPKGKYVLHTCDNRKCVNPKHLFIGNQKDNMVDMMNKGRNADTSGENNGRHRLDKNAIKVIKILYKDGMSQKDIANKFYVGRSTISHLLVGDTWKKI